MSHPELEKLYSLVPDIKCKGLCYGECTAIVMSELEGRLMTAAGGAEPTLTADDACNYLTDDKRCSIYEARPLICRVFGTTPRLACPFGCVPEKWLTDDGVTMLKFLIGKAGGPDVCNFDDAKLKKLVKAAIAGEIMGRKK